MRRTASRAIKSGSDFTAPLRDASITARYRSWITANRGRASLLLIRSRFYLSPPPPPLYFFSFFLQHVAYIARRVRVSAAESRIKYTGRIARGFNGRSPTCGTLRAFTCIQGAPLVVIKLSRMTDLPRLSGLRAPRRADLLAGLARGRRYVPTRSLPLSLSLTGRGHVSFRKLDRIRARARRCACVRAHARDRLLL